jgi:hypothetical protein
MSLLGAQDLSSLACTSKGMEASPRCSAPRVVSALTRCCCCVAAGAVRLLQPVVWTASERLQARLRGVACAAARLSGVFRAASSSAAACVQFSLALSPKAQYKALYSVVMEQRREKRRRAEVRCCRRQRHGPLSTLTVCASLSCAHMQRDRLVMQQQTGEALHRKHPTLRVFSAAVRASCCPAGRAVSTPHRSLLASRRRTLAPSHPRSIAPSSPTRCIPL